MLIDVQNLSVCGGLADLGVTERGLSVLRAVVSKNVRGCHDPFASGASFFLEALSDDGSLTTTSE